MIAITGGGTGGHLVIAKAVKEALNQHGIEPLYIGSTSGQDRQWFENDTGWSGCHFLPSQGVVNQKGIRKLSSLWHTLKLAFTCKALLKHKKITVLFSVGGYSAAPASFAALMQGIPLYIHEQNAITGKLNALLRPFAKAFFSSYDATAVHTDYPIREAFFATRRTRDTLKTLLFLGGSQGAHFINELAKNLAPILHVKGIAIIHQCGAKEFDALHAFYADHKIPVMLYAFYEKMPDLLAQADVAISRAGASTLWELCATGLPTLFIPFPHAAANHQYHNAKMLCDQNLALLMEQSQPWGNEEILRSLESLPLKSISQALMQTISPGGAEAIAQHLLKHFKENPSC